MFAVTGKIWSIDKVEFQNKTYYQMVVKKKRHDRELSMCFLIFKEEVIKQYKDRYFDSGDTVQIKFYIKANQFKDRWYNNLFVDKMSVLKKNKNRTLNMFEKNNDSLESFYE
jgi:hypothetical protein